MVLRGFWSYVHVDDEAEGGRISQLARDVVSQFALLTGEQIDLFLDKDALKWGDEWRAEIDSTLASVAFFVPVLTPRYFMSAECRRELQYFARRTTELGIRELVLPLLYVTVPALDDIKSEDELVKICQAFQWQDWRDLRLADVGAEKYRRAVAELASRLVDANRQAEVVESAAAAVPVTDIDSQDDEEAGLLNRVANAEETLPKWNETINAIGEVIHDIGQVMVDGTADMHRATEQNKGFGGRMYVARTMARRLAEPAERIATLTNQFSTQLHSVDDGFRTLIAQAAAEAPDDPAAVAAFCEFFHMVAGMASASREAMDTVQGMIEQIAPLERMSRDLRPPLRRLREGLTVMLEVREVANEWLSLINATGIECGPAADEAQASASGA